MASKHDVVIIGGGPGGYAAALYGAAAGLDVAMVEMADVGGTCLHRGCIPAKELLETATVGRTVAAAGDFGFDVDEPGLDYARTHARKRQIIDQLTKGLTGLLDGRKVTVLSGVGTYAGDGRVVVTGDDADRARRRRRDPGRRLGAPVAARLRHRRRPWSSPPTSSSPSRSCPGGRSSSAAARSGASSRR